MAREDEDRRIDAKASAEDLVANWRAKHPDSLTDQDADAIVALCGDLSGIPGLGSMKVGIRGDPGRPTVYVVVQYRWTEAVSWSYEWRLRDDPEDPIPDHMPIHGLIGDHLWNPIYEGVHSFLPPLWAPDEEGVIHVDVVSERFRDWPSERTAIGNPYYRKEEGGLATWNGREYQPWVPPPGHPWERILENGL
jgi:hypothetical protein